ncbi:hypothetical protein HYU16_02905 [Candidatus Woesearchaeota archaeon]|nr:hypothetical protein [Candidatus Woesearchaeota archaeon]
MSKQKLTAQGKKGLTQSQTVGMLAVLGLGILLLQFTKPLVSVANAQSIIEDCKFSVGLSSWQLNFNNWVKDINVVDSPFRLNCKTIFTEITKESINRADDKIKLSNDPTERVDQLKEAIMKNMRECWYMYGEGKVKIQQTGLFENGETSCLVCSEIVPNQEFIDKFGNKNPLDAMYTYAVNSRIPPKDEKSYMNYLLEGADPRPTGYPDRSVVLDRQYSVVFAVHSKEDVDSVGEKVTKKVFGWDSKANTSAGIVDCYVGGEGKLTGDEAEEIGCDSSGNNPGLIFGKVVDGGTNVELATWKNLVVGVATGGVGILIGGDTFRLKTYPETVRLVPTESLAKYCKRLY